MDEWLEDVPLGTWLAEAAELSIVLIAAVAVYFVTR